MTLNWSSGKDRNGMMNSSLSGRDGEVRACTLQVEVGWHMGVSVKYQETAEASMNICLKICFFQNQNCSVA